MGNDVTMSIRQIKDHALLAVEHGHVWNDAGNDAETDTAWTSTDGRTWTLAPNANKLGSLTVLSNGTRCVAYSPAPGQLAVYSFDDDLTLRVLAQTGAPADGWVGALGPTGLLVTVDGTRFWIGVPRSS